MYCKQWTLIGRVEIDIQNIQGKDKQIERWVHQMQWPSEIPLGSMSFLDQLTLTYEKVTDTEMETSVTKQE